MSFYNEEELKTIGFKSFGSNILISRFCRIYNPSNIVLGNNIRIDDFSIISAGSEPFILEDYIHISAGVYLYGTGGIIIKSYSNISSGTKLFSVSDTFDGTCLIGPMVDINLRKVIKSPIIIEKYVVIGANCVVLPGIHLEEGVAIGANSLVNSSCKSWNIYVGSPIKLLKERSNYCKNLEFSLNI
jgi:galactoside O-acetyltransferase